MVVTLWNSDLWMEHMSRSPEAFFKLFWPCSRVSAGSSFTCQGLTLNTSRESLSEPQRRWLSSGMFRDKMVRTFYSCSLESVVFKNYSCFFLYCFISELHPFQVQIWRWSEEVFYEALLFRVQSGND